MLLSDPVWLNNPFGPISPKWSKAALSSSEDHASSWRGPLTPFSTSIASLNLRGVKLSAYRLRAFFSYNAFRVTFTVKDIPLKVLNVIFEDRNIWPRELPHLVNLLHDFFCKFSLLGGHLIGVCLGDDRDLGCWHAHLLLFCLRPFDGTSRFWWHSL